MEKMKTPWQKPTLMILIRNRSQEAVLQICKHANIGGPGQVLGAGGFHDWCKVLDTPCVACDNQISS